MKEWLMELIAGEESTYGYRKLAICLRRNHNLVINNKKVYRLCAELNILNPQRKLKVKYPRRIAINREVTASDQLWETEIKYGYIAEENRFLYLLSIIDVYDRTLVDYHIGLSCEGRLLTESAVKACFTWYFSVSLNIFKHQTNTKNEVNPTKTRCFRALWGISVYVFKQDMHGIGQSFEHANMFKCPLDDPRIK
nr:IS3 family transposase [Heliorestis convoluta]